MPKVRGPLPRFSKIHIQMALDLISKRTRIGRQEIAEKLKIGEGSVRTILDYLKDRGFITSSRGGHALTEKGKSLLGKPPEFVHVDVGNLTVGKVNVATIARGAAYKVKRGIEQRDEAIKVGAEGATVLVFKGGKLRFQGGFVKVGKEASQALMTALKPAEGDVVIIGTAKDMATAEAGTRAAVLTLRRKA
ncbi:MAG: DUF4443 domain-containing protein [Methanobacteriota archaeon]